MNGNDSAGTGTPAQILDRLAYSLPETGRLLSCSRRKVSNLIAAGDLEVTYVGNLRRVTAESILAFVERGKAKARALTAA